MYKPSYYKRVMESEHNFIVVRASRRTGKTTLAIKWAINQPGTSLFIVPSRHQVGAVQNIMAYYLGLSIVINTPGVIQTMSGKRIHIISSRDTQAVRGMLVDNIIVDEFGSVDASWMDTINQLRGRKRGVRLFMLSSANNPGSIGPVIENHRPDIHYIAYSHRDALLENTLSVAELAELIKTSNSKMFINEFGPWEGFWGVPAASNNEEYSHLLRRMETV